MKALQRKLAAFPQANELRKKGLYPFYQKIESGQACEVILNKKKLLMFGSNSYLGLTNHPELKRAARAAINKYGTGSSGSRLMNGNLDLHEKLDNALAQFVNKDAAVVFSTGFQANLGTVSCLMGRNDYIIIDEKNHASILEGCRLSFAKVLKYKHSDMHSLESMLQKTQGDHLRLIITDGIFSMEGDVAKLDEINQLAQKYSASIMVDDAHAIGVLGENGTGTASHFGLDAETDLIMGTFSKSLASLGGFIAGDNDTIDFVKHQARSLLFSASIPPASAATVLKALEIIKKEPDRLVRLWENTNYAKQCLLQEGFNIGNSTTPIIPIFIGDDVKMFQYFNLLIERGVYINSIVHPGVEHNKAMLRLSLMATHSKKQIDYAISTLVTCRKIVEKQTKSLIL